MPASQQLDRPNSLLQRTVCAISPSFIAGRTSRSARRLRAGIDYCTHSIQGTMEGLAAQPLSQSLANVAYDQRWEILKPTIERMYVHEGSKLKDIIAAIKDEYGFNAV